MSIGKLQVSLRILLVSYLFNSSVLFAQIQTGIFQTQSPRSEQSSANNIADVQQFIARDGQGQTLSPATDIIQPDDSSSDIVPYGANLFSSGIEVTNLTGINPSYLIVPGDKISVQLWGTVSFASVFTVDTQGVIFIPEVGPIQVGGIPASRLSQVITNEIKKVYTQNVNVYTNLLTASPIGVYVTGSVIRPGHYAGLSSDPLLHYLKRAGGIDANRGSYRKIDVFRDGQLVKSFDLYPFLKKGFLDTFSFQNSDVILVQEQGDVVKVSGSAKNQYQFELLENEKMGNQLVRYALPLPAASHVAISGDRHSGPFSIYITLEEFASFELENGDTLLFNDDLKAEVVSVSVSGSHLGPSFYAVKTGSRLKELLANVEVDPKLADLNSLYIKRESVAQRQAELLEESIRRLERSVLTAPASSEGEARIRVQEAQLISQFIERARQVVPIGKVVVSLDGNVADISLEENDEVVIPAKTDLIQVSGEVLIPQAVVFNKTFNLKDYINAAGGFTDRSNKDRIAIIHANGLVTFANANRFTHWFNSDIEGALKAGDQILVLPAVDNKILQAVKDITQIIFQIAVAANVALD